jgi:hypothetical protein
MRQGLMRQGLMRQGLMRVGPKMLTARNVAHVHPVSPIVTMAVSQRNPLGLNVAKLR